MLGRADNGGIIPVRLNSWATIGWFTFIGRFLLMVFAQGIRLEYPLPSNPLRVSLADLSGPPGGMFPNACSMVEIVLQLRIELTPQGWECIHSAISNNLNFLEQSISSPDSLRVQS